MKKSLYEPRKLTYEEHKKIDEFLKHWNKEGQVIFDLLRQAFGDHQKPVVNMAKFINLMSPLRIYCADKALLDIPKIPAALPGDPETDKWYALYKEITFWTTEGWR
jgi:hypothetical protein